MAYDLRQQFPILSTNLRNQPLVWLDNAATTQKPQVVIDTINNYYRQSNANVHRAVHTLSAQATHAFEAARSTVAGFLNARSSDEIIWTRGATEAINLFAQSWGRANLNAGDEIILSEMEHHANIVPWQLLAQELAFTIHPVRVSENGELDRAHLQQLLQSPKVKLLAITHVSNALGTINPIEEIIEAARQHNITTLIDGSQAVGHFPVDVQALGCDFYAFSGHKVYGPTGVGVLYGRRELLADMPPWQGGGEMIERVSFSGTTFRAPPLRFEPGTPHIAGAIGLAAAIDFLSSLDRKAIAQHEHKLRQKLEQGLDQIDGIRRIGTSSNRVAIVSFCCDTLHNQDLATLLDQQGIAVRTGHHCAMPLMEALKIPGTIRASLACYNTMEDVDALLSALRTALSTDHFAEESAQPPIAATNPELPTVFAEQPYFSLPATDELIAALLAKKHWQDRYRVIMQLAAKLPTLPEEMRNIQTQLPSCESALWFHHYYDATSRTVHFAIDSDARIIRGLLFIVLSVLNGRTAAELLAVDVDSLFTELGLTNHLSPSRGNGLYAIVQEMRGTAERYL